jgi:hypothetical protein
MPAQKGYAVFFATPRGIVSIRIVMILLSLTTMSACGQNSPNAGRETRAVSPDSRNATEVIMKLEQQRRTALLKSDFKTLDHLTATGYTQISPDGAVVSKAQLLAAIRSGELRFQAIDYEAVQIRVTGDAVLVTGLSSVKGHCGSKDISGSYEVSRVYEKRNDTWEVALQRDSRSQVSLDPDATPGALEDARPAKSQSK